MFEVVLKLVVGMVAVFVKTVFVVGVSDAFCVFVLVLGNVIGVVVNGIFVFDVEIVVDVVVADVLSLGIVDGAVAVLRFCSVVVGFGVVVKCFDDVSILVIGEVGDCVIIVNNCVVL